MNSSVTQTSFDAVGSLRANGYSVLSGVVSASFIKAANTEIELFLKGQWEIYREERFPGIDRACAFLFTRNDNYRRILYKRINALMRSPVLLWDEEIVLQICSALGYSYPIMHSHAIRIALPDECHMSTEWHQDIGVMNTEEAVTFWVPLSPIRKHSGTLALKPGSHLEGVIKPERINYRGHSVISDHILEKYPSVSFDYDVGDMLIFDPALLHNVMPNTSEVARMVVLLRIENSQASDYFDLDKNPLNAGYIMSKDSTSRSGFSEGKIHANDYQDSEAKTRLEKYLDHK